MKQLPTLPATLSFLFFLGACTSQPQPVSAPLAASAPKAKTQAAPSAKPETVTPVATSTAPEPEPTPVAEPEPAPPPAVHPVEVLTGRETAFVIDYANSGAKAVIDKLCASQPSNAKSSDTEVDADEQQRKFDLCLKKERSKFTADVLRFRSDERGNGTLTIYRRTGSALPEVYVAKVKYEEVQKDRVKVTVTAGLSGTRPICRDRQALEVVVPNGYSIELVDSVYGRLPYDAKVGLVAD